MDEKIKKELDGDKLVAQWYLGKLIKAGTKTYEFNWKHYRDSVIINGGVYYGLWAI